MAISKPKLPPRKGYVEVEEDGKRGYRPIATPATDAATEPGQTDVDLMAEAYREGVNEA